jgi:hydrogenase maturation protein HypF
MTAPLLRPSAVLATGAFLKNTCGLLHDGCFISSQVHGDLEAAVACLALSDACEGLLARAGGCIDAVAHDLHPDFPSTRLALALAARLQVPAVAVQHHHAHAAAVLAEHGLPGPAVALVLDGYGLGPDGQAWGGELLVIDAGGGFERAGHLWPLLMVGGDRAAREPWRLAAAALHALGRGDEIGPRFGARVGTALAGGVAGLLQRGGGLVTTSAGRWFDAAAAALGLASMQTHEAEAAMALEQAAAACRWPVPAMALPCAQGVVDLRPLLAAMAALGDAGQVAEGAALFHASLADALAGAAAATATARGLRTVVLGGGCLANRLLRHRLADRLADAGLDVRLPLAAPPGDAGLARGQAWVAARLLPSAQSRSARSAAVPCAVGEPA